MMFNKKNIKINMVNNGLNNNLSICTQCFDFSEQYLSKDMICTLNSLINNGKVTHFEVQNIKIINKEEYMNILASYQNKPKEITINYTCDDGFVVIRSLIIMSDEMIVDETNQEIFNEWIARHLIIKFEEIEESCKITDSSAKIDYGIFKLIYANLKHEPQTAMCLASDLFIQSSLEFNDIE